MKTLYADRVIECRGEGDYIEARRALRDHLVAERSVVVVTTEGMERRFDDLRDDERVGLVVVQ